jgi:hypothetical protein
MKKLPKYLITSNYLVSDRIYMVHTQLPKFIGEVLKFNSKPEFERWQIGAIDKLTCKINDFEAFVGTHTTKGKEIIAMYVIEFLDDPSENDLPLKGEIMKGGLMARTGDWLYTYFNK